VFDRRPLISVPLTGMEEKEVMTAKLNLHSPYYDRLVQAGKTGKQCVSLLLQIYKLVYRGLH